jgi:hypothetical protein
MKTLLVIILFIPLCCYSQEGCKVLLPELDSVYYGSCKKGLAHGLGEAYGDFHYNGKFSKGLPHGKGKADYPNGNIYDGSWRKGLRDGKGTLIFKENGKTVEKTYTWSKGEKLREILPPAYKVITQRNVNRLRIYKQGSENRVWFYPKSIGGADSENEDIRVSGNSGTETSLSSKIGFESVTFPFKGSIRYKTWNKLHTTKFEVYLEIEVLEPGNWIIEIQN